MDRYHVALFLHIVTLIAAVSATAVTKLAVARRIRARTIAEVIEWHSILISASKIFPVCLAAFVITGSYMLSVANMHAWTSGFVVAGFVGVAWLLASGIYLSMKAKALKAVLEKLAKSGADRPAPPLVPPPVVAALPFINTGVAIAVVFDMATKPSRVPVALLVVAIGAAVGVAPSIRRARKLSLYTPSLHAGP